MTYQLNLFGLVQRMKQQLGLSLPLVEQLLLLPAGIPNTEIGDAADANIYHRDDMLQVKHQLPAVIAPEAVDANEDGSIVQLKNCLFRGGVLRKLCLAIQSCQDKVLPGRQQSANAGKLHVLWVQEGSLSAKHNRSQELARVMSLPDRHYNCLSKAIALAKSFGKESAANVAQVAIWRLFLENETRNTRRTIASLQNSMGTVGTNQHRKHHQSKMVQKNIK
jgi:hypothetical protein